LVGELADEFKASDDAKLDTGAEPGVAEREPEGTSSSTSSGTPGVCAPEDGVGGLERRCPSSDSGSTRSGGNRSFSMSDFLL